MDSLRRRNRRLVLQLVLGGTFMFGFGFALVPLYDVFCRITGLNGKITNTGPVAIEVADTSRDVRVQFIGVNNEGMPWEFRPLQHTVSVNPGEMRQMAFYARNPTGRRMVAQAVPSVTPSEAAQYLHKVSCFCFDQQPLEADEGLEMPLLFVIDKKLPADINTITLSYTLFDITPTLSTGQVKIDDTQRSTL
ncbi:cytochrome c oxidase assembly protein [Marinobacterium rhizophilum]|uniref:Cytochrome c oxidase assembly protein CtaG n=1 Tax=Marinobacterium rhizophilum TaxID=420402 RepID=A0ABY5HFJ5_9GAMM|nr:cytochrome c oxidase assembly protein [Marinobacterium rhizophilum]UTW11130.1 cytochrome c oxidase assembly protein [Marinobacterium rhizophilum]